MNREIEMYSTKTLVRYLTLCVLLLGLTSNAPAADLPKQCNERICFLHKEGKEEYERENACLAQDNCDYAVSRVKHELKTILKTDPTYGFYRNQACIADKSCSNRSILENKKWLTNVVNDFITPLVNEEGKWKVKKKECDGFFVAKSLRCQAHLAEYHIETDLQASVNKNGCGTIKDWDQIGTWLKACVDTGVKEDLFFGFESAGYGVAVVILAWDRSSVRSACITDRTARKLDIEGK